jgi:large subunit ribosomal protein L29
MDAKELRTKSASDLSDELLKLRKEQFALRMQRATGQSPKPDQFMKVRRNIARLKTVQREVALRAGATASTPGKTAAASEKR